MSLLVVICRAASPTVAAPENFREPSTEELNADGAWLIGRRVSIAAYGSGMVVAFNKNTGWGASTHDIDFDDGIRRSLKLQRKSNTDPDKLPWKVSPPVRGQ